MEETVTISKVEYDELKNDAFFLQCLDNAGVDNWEGYSDAVREYRAANGEED